jgi:hypothetical protein
MQDLLSDSRQLRAQVREGYPESSLDEVLAKRIMERNDYLTTCTCLCKI